MGSERRYEDVPYGGRAFPQTHPDRLFCIGRLFGVPAPDPAASRVMELGCGDGANLLPMAHGLPGATFTGIDTSPSAIAAARARAAELGLRNITFEEISLADLEVAPGSFDYVLAHGVFSWVPAPVRDALLALAGRALSDHGIAYVSYNALPGGRLRDVLREILAVQLEGIDEPAQRLADARERLAVLRAAWAYDESLAPFCRLASNDIEASDALLYHDTLAPENTRFYFREFVEHAARHDLRFLSEAGFWEMQVGWLAPEARPALLAIDDRLRREQELDFMRMRTFRQTLLCRADQELSEIEPQRLEGLAVAASLSADEPAEDGTVTFRGARGQALRAGDADVIAALRTLAAAWPSTLAVASLWPAGAAPELRAAVCETLLQCYSADLVTLHAAPLATGDGAGQRPRASEPARLLARAGAPVANLRHEAVELDDRLALLVTLLDGSRDRAALRAELGGGDGLEDDLRELARKALLLPDVH